MGLQLGNQVGEPRWPARQGPTSAILGSHTYGTPCDTEALGGLARGGGIRYGNPATTPASSASTRSIGHYAATALASFQDLEERVGRRNRSPSATVRP